jgi:ABC-type transport system involved in multi-copper enzyme maturation permease subunit
MILSPIIHVELLTIGRRTRYFIARVVYALILLTTMYFCYSAAFHRFYYGHTPTLQDQSRFAYSFFFAFSWIQLFVVLGLTPAMTAGTISVEHERKTIDYLLTTQLSDTEIALGKFAARVWSVLMQLAVGLPILAIALTLGGVSPAQLFTSFGVSMLVLLFTATLSLALSSRAARSREAITRAYLVIVALLSIPPLAFAICEGLSQSQHEYPTIAAIADYVKVPLGWITSFHPMVFLTSVLMDSPSFLHKLTFGWFAVGYLGASALMAAWAVVSVRRFYLKQAGRSVATTSWFGKLRERFQGKRRPVGEQAMLWKEITSLRSAINLGASGRIASALIFLAIVYGIGTAFYETVTRDYWRAGRYSYHDELSPIERMAIGLGPTIFGLIVLLVTSNSAGSITSEREKDTWTTLISTPLEGRDILWSKFYAVCYGVRYWYLLIVLMWALVLPFRPGILFVVPFVMATHAVAIFFAGAVGLRCSLQASTSLKSMGMALAIMVVGVVFVPLVAAGFGALLFWTGEIPAFLIPFSLPVLFGSMHFVIAENMNSSRSMDGTGAVAFIMGCFSSFTAYALAAWAIYERVVQSFDQHAGRTMIDAFEPRDPRRGAVLAQARAPILEPAEVVEERKPDGERA